MTLQTVEPPHSRPTPPEPPRVSLGRSQARRDQLICVAVILVCLVLIALFQPLVNGQRNQLVQERGDQSLRTLYVEFPKLTLGGFRGLVAMALWQQAEDAKNDRKWQDLETYYNIIGKLEPYFVSVYTFHAWNQSYNLSAQWHDEDTKYKWVLDGMQYLYEGETYNPGNADLMKEEADDYFLKLGGSFERIYYRKHWRFDIQNQYKNLMHRLPQGENNDTFQEVYNLVSKPEFHADWINARLPNGSLEAGHGVEITAGPWKGLQFRYGLSPFYFGYIEYQRCNQHGGPTTMGKKVAESLEPMAIRLWCRDDMYYSEDVVQDMFYGHMDGYQDPDAFDDKIMKVRDCYRNINGDPKKDFPGNASLAVDAFKLFLIKYPEQKGVHLQHQFESQMLGALSRADRELFEGLVAWNNQGKTWEPGDAVNQHLLKSIDLYDQAIVAMDAFRNIAFTNEKNPDWVDFNNKYEAAVRTRQEGIRNFLAQENRKAAPDLSFLTSRTIER